MHKSRLFSYLLECVAQCTLNSLQVNTFVFSFLNNGSRSLSFFTFANFEKWDFFISPFGLCSIRSLFQRFRNVLISSHTSSEQLTSEIIEWYTLCNFVLSIPKMNAKFSFQVIILAEAFPMWSSFSNSWRKRRSKSSADVDFPISLMTLWSYPSLSASASFRLRYTLHKTYSVTLPSFANSCRAILVWFPPITSTLIAFFLIACSLTDCFVMPPVMFPQNIVCTSGRAVNESFRLCTCSRSTRLSRRLLAGSIRLDNDTFMALPEE